MSKIENLIKNNSFETPLEIEFQDNNILKELCGIRDQNLILLEDKLNIQITRRGNVLSLSGNLEVRKKASILLKSIYSSLDEGRGFYGNDVIDLILSNLDMDNLSLKNN